jgi:type I restriction enzyme S subunit
MTKKSDAPAIRFKGFSDAWEQRKLGDIADIVGGGTPSTGNQSYWDGDIDWYAPAEIADQIYANLSQKKITSLGYENSSAKMLPPGTVLFTSRAGIGKTAILTRKGCTNQGFQSIVPHRGELDSYFIFSRTGELKRYGELVGAGSTFVEVSGKQMAVMELMMPPTMREQQTIGGFFQQLDHLITLHQRKFEKLTNVKKSMLEKMFPQNGSSYPEIRFKGFTDPWEQRKLGELVDVCSGRDYKHLSEGTIPVYGTGGYMLSVNDALSYDRDAIGIGRKGTIDRPYILKAPFWTVDTLFYAIPREKADLNFAFDIFQNIDWKKKDESTGVPSLSKTAINDIDVLAPKHGEQQTIGQFFAAIDHLITLHQRELEKLQNIKKSMLEKMFV